MVRLNIMQRTLWWHVGSYDSEMSVLIKKAQCEVHSFASLVKPKHFKRNIRNKLKNLSPRLTSYKNHFVQIDFFKSDNFFLDNLHIVSIGFYWRSDDDKRLTQSAINTFLFYFDSKIFTLLRRCTQMYEIIELINSIYTNTDQHTYTRIIIF